MSMPMSRLVSRIALALVLMAAATPAAALTPDYLWNVDRCRTDDELFLNLVVRDSGVSRTVLEPVLPRVRSLSADLPVILFISRNSGRPVGAIMDLRLRGMSWTEVFRQLGIGYDTLFVDLDRDPGPPYRTAWTYWRRSPAAPRLTDYQVRDLVQLQLVHRLSAVPVIQIVQARAGGRSPVMLMAEKHGRPYAVAGIPPGHGGIPPGHGGVPPGQVKSATPPGHRTAEAATSSAPGKAKARGAKSKARPSAGAAEKGGEQGRGKGKGRGRGGR